jgi:hypothetical protein
LASFARLRPPPDPPDVVGLGLVLDERVQVQHWVGDQRRDVALVRRPLGFDILADVEVGGQVQTRLLCRVAGDKSPVAPVAVVVVVGGRHAVREVVAAERVGVVDLNHGRQGHLDAPYYILYG